MAKKIILIVAIVLLLIAAFLLGIWITQEKLSIISSAHQEHYASTELEKWRMNVVNAQKMGESSILEWTLDRYAKELSEHIELARSQKWYEFHEDMLLFKLALTKANLAHFYKHKNDIDQSRDLIQEAFDLLRKSDPKKFNSIEDVWAFSGKRLMYDPLKIKWQSAKCSEGPEEP